MMAKSPVGGDGTDHVLAHAHAHATDDKKNASDHGLDRKIEEMKTGEMGSKIHEKIDEGGDIMTMMKAMIDSGKHRHPNLTTRRRCIRCTKGM
jgi:hypothetical protein